MRLRKCERCFELFDSGAAVERRRYRNTVHGGWRYARVPKAPGQLVVSGMPGNQEDQ